VAHNAAQPAANATTVTRALRSGRPTTATLYAAVAAPSTRAITGVVPMRHGYPSLRRRNRSRDLDADNAGVVVGVGVAVREHVVEPLLKGRL